MKPEQLKIGKPRKRDPRLVPKKRPAGSPELERALHQILEPGFGGGRKKIAGADKIPDNIKGLNFGEERLPSEFGPGRWVLRNGSIAVIEEPVTLKFGIQGRQTWQGWKGQLEGHTGEKLVWGLDGKRSDAAPAHEHDIMHRHKPKPKKVKK